MQRHLSYIIILIYVKMHTSDPEFNLYLTTYNNNINLYICIYMEHSSRNHMLHILAANLGSSLFETHT